MILTPDYLRGFYDGVTHKDTPVADLPEDWKLEFMEGDG